MPDCFELLRRRLEADGGAHGRREFIKTLRLLETVSIPMLAQAIERALEIDVLAVDAIRLLVQQGRMLAHVRGHTTIHDKCYALPRRLSRRITTDTPDTRS